MRLLLFILSVSVSSAFCETPPYEQVTVVQSTKIPEDSGLDLSYKYPNAVWIHNDSGGKPYLFLVSLSTGETLATVMIEGCLDHDWEDIVTYQKDGKSYIIVADTGDNPPHRRREYQLCILEEPDLDLGKEGAKNDTIHPIRQWIDFRFRYEDGPKNCESIGVDVANNQLILIEKVYEGAKGNTGIFRLDIPATNKLDGVAQRIGELKAKNFSALDISDDGLTLIARAYHAGYLFRRTGGESWIEAFAKPEPLPFEFPFQLQGEGVCFTPDGKSVLISSEKIRQPIYKVELPGVK